MIACGSDRTSTEDSNLSASAASAACVTDGGSEAGPAGSCYANIGSCDPTVPSSCPDGYACDYEIVNGVHSPFKCYPPPNTAAVGERCESTNGPFCAQGATCRRPSQAGGTGVCSAYCCEDSQCPSGTRCVQDLADDFVGSSTGNHPTKICVASAAAPASPRAPTP